MKKIYLVRHTDYANPRKILPGRLPVELSMQGKKDAWKLNAWFANKQIEKIYSSAVLRCRQTSQIIADKKIPIKFDQRLLEVFSAYQGYWYQDTANWSHFFSHRLKLGGENLAQVQKRMVDFWQELIAKKEERVLVCSHGDPIYVLYLYLKNKPLIADETKENQLSDYPAKGSITVVKWQNSSHYQVLGPKNIF